MSYFGIRYGILLLTVTFLALFDLTLGSVHVGAGTIVKTIFSYDPANAEEMVVTIFRLPRVMSALLGGAALAVSGLLMQTLFQNPLAGPYVLGINSGSSFMVALLTMSGLPFFISDFSIVGAALFGALLTGLFILFCSIYVKSKVSLLLVGIMFGAFAGAMVSVLQSYSAPEDLKVFMMWSFGSLQQLQSSQMGIFSGFILIGLISTSLLVKPLNTLLLGEDHARFLGVRVKPIRLSIVLVTAVLTGTVTAFCGPIAFIGLIVPNIVKLFMKTAHHGHLVIGSIFLGSIALVTCDIFMQVIPFHLPLNALTALIGAPVVIWIILKRF